MQETKETEEKNKDGITIQELTEKIRQMDQEEFIVNYICLFDYLFISS